MQPRVQGGFLRGTERVVVDQGKFFDNKDAKKGGPSYVALSLSLQLPPVTTKTKSTTDPAVSEWFRLKGEELEERKRRLRAFCSRRPDLGRLRVLPKRDLMVTTRHNLTYCRQAKVDI